MNHSIIYYKYQLLSITPQHTDSHPCTRPLCIEINDKASIEVNDLPLAFNKLGRCSAMLHHNY